MSILNSCSFIFNGMSSADYGVVIGWLNSDRIDVSINGLNRQIKKSTKPTKMKDNIYETEYTESINFSFDIISQNNEEITRPQSIRINQWLTSSPTPQLLKFNDRDGYDLHYYAVCTNINDIVIGGRLVGKELKFETNSSYAFSKKREKIFEIYDSQNFSIMNSSDTHNGIYYPTITLFTQSDKITIENMTDRKSVTIFTEKILPDNNGDKIITIDSENMKVLDKDNNLIPVSKIGWTEDYKSYVLSTEKFIETIYWPRLLKGHNEFKIIGTCILKLTYEFPRKAGCL